MTPSPQKTALIIGAGPGGLTAAYELLKRTDVLPIVIEASDIVGGISSTLVYKGNRIDIGGHRFFSKSDWVMNWWQDILPVQKSTSNDDVLTYRGKKASLKTKEGGGRVDADKVMLLRPRKSRIYYRGKFFDYPISLSFDTLRKLGFWKTLKIGFSYIFVILKPIPHPKNLEEFYISKFGRELYNTFFREYTEKVWGLPCSEISAEWGAQRVKGLSLIKTVTHVIKKTFSGITFGDKKVETSLIEQFLYPKYGPGQMWETVAEKVVAMGGTIKMNHALVRLDRQGDSIVSAYVLEKGAAEPERIEADYIFSTMPLKELLRAVVPKAPAEILAVSDGLLYRDFVTVGILLKKLRITEADGSLIKDTWIYIQEPDAKVGRIQIFNNWSPYLVADPSTVWIGLEYFCTEGDSLWSMTEQEMKEFAIKEVSRIGIINATDVLDATVIKVKKTYPGYFGTYDRFDEVQHYADGIKNLFLVGRNGMHKYNNQDHSMLTAKTAVDNILAGRTDKSNIWAINTEQDYHEEKKG